MAAVFASGAVPGRSPGLPYCRCVCEHILKSTGQHNHAAEHDPECERGRSLPQRRALDRAALIGTARDA